MLSLLLSLHREENFSGGNVTWKNLGISQTITHEFYFPRQTATVSLHFPPMLALISLSPRESHLHDINVRLEGNESKVRGGREGGREGS